MSDLWQRVKSLFQTAAESSSNEPVIHELLVRAEAEKVDYARWKERLIRRRLIDWLNDQYAIFQVTPKAIDKSLAFLETPSMKGFAILFHQTNYSREDVSFLMDYLREQVLTLPYRKQLSDVREFNRPNWVERIERHYLKPQPSFMFTEGELLDQLFGNILIEVILRNNQPHQLKFSATIYADRQYKKGGDFRKLMSHLLQ